MTPNLHTIPALEFPHLRGKYWDRGGWKILDYADLQGCTEGALVG